MCLEEHGCVQGIAPFGLDIVLLTYVLDEGGSPTSADGARSQQEAMRPEVSASSPISVTRCA